MGEAVEHDLIKRITEAVKRLEAAETADKNRALSAVLFALGEEPIITDLRDPEEYRVAAQYAGLPVEEFKINYDARRLRQRIILAALQGMLYATSTGEPWKELRVSDD